MVVFKANFPRNRLVLHWSDQLFEHFSNRGHQLLSQQQYAPEMNQPLTSQLVPKFWQHNLRLVVSGRCLHDSVTKFQDKFVSLLQVNSLNSWDKFHKCYTDMYLISFLPNFVAFCVFLWILRDFGDSPEFRGSTTTWNIRSPVLAMTDSLLSEVYNNLYSVLTFISTQRPKQHSTYFSGLSGYFILISWFFVTFFSNISNILLRDPTSRASTYKKKKTKFTIKKHYCPVTTKLLLMIKILPPVKQKEW